MNIPINLSQVKNFIQAAPEGSVELPKTSERAGEISTQVQELLTNVATEHKLDSTQQKEFYSQVQGRVEDMTASIQQLPKDAFLNMLNSIAKDILGKPASDRKAACAVKSAGQLHSQKPQQKRSFHELKQKVMEFNPPGVKSATQLSVRAKALEQFLTGVSKEEIATLKDIPQFRAMISATGGHPEVLARCLTAGHLGVLAQDVQIHNDLSSVIGKLPDDANLKGKLMAMAEHTRGGLDNALAALAAKLPLADRQEVIRTVNAASKQAKLSPPTSPQPKRADGESPPSSPSIPKWKQKQLEEAQMAKDEAAALQAALVARGRAQSDGKPLSGPVQNEVTVDTLVESLGKSVNKDALRSDLTKIMKDGATTREFMSKLDAQGLDKFWRVESQVVNQKNEIDDRKIRMEHFLPSLSNAQLESSVEHSGFILLVGDLQSGYAEKAAETLSAKQFGIIAKGCHTQEQYEAFAHLIDKLDPSDKTATQEKITEAVNNLSSSDVVLNNSLQRKMGPVFNKAERDSLLAKLPSLPSET